MGLDSMKAFAEDRVAVGEFLGGCGEVGGGSGA
jgi:hypothetical protein